MAGEALASFFSDFTPRPAPSRRLASAGGFGGGDGGDVTPPHISEHDIRLDQTDWSGNVTALPFRP